MYMKHDFISIKIVHQKLFQNDDLNYHPYYFAQTKYRLAPTIQVEKYTLK